MAREPFSDSLCAGTTSLATVSSALPLRAQGLRDGFYFSLSTFNFRSKIPLSSELSTPLRVANHVTSVQKMPHAGKYHRQSKPVRRRDHIGIAHRAARLDHRRGPRFPLFFNSISTWTDL